MPLDRRLLRTHRSTRPRRPVVCGRHRRRSPRARVVAPRRSRRDLCGRPHGRIRRWRLLARDRENAGARGAGFRKESHRVDSAGRRRRRIGLRSRGRADDVCVGGRCGRLHRTVRSSAPARGCRRDADCRRPRPRRAHPRLPRGPRRGHARAGRHRVRCGGVRIHRRHPRRARQTAERADRRRGRPCRRGRLAGALRRGGARSRAQSRRALRWPRRIANQRRHT